MVVRAGNTLTIFVTLVIWAGGRNGVSDRNYLMWVFGTAFATVDGQMTTPRAIRLAELEAERETMYRVYNPEIDK